MNRYRMTYRGSAALCLLLTTLLLPGCSGTEAPKIGKLIPVTGQVNLDGKPLGHASVTFVPRGSTAGTGAYGVTDDSGKYTLTHRTQQPGIEAGAYTVIVSKMTMPDGKPIPEGQNAADVGAVQQVPQIYTDPNREAPPLTATVSEQATNFDFDLKSK